MNNDKIRKDPDNKHKVVLVGYSALRTFEFGCAVEIFGLDRPELNVGWYEFVVCGIEERTVNAAGGFTVTFDHGSEQLDDADTIILPGWRDVLEAPPQILIEQLIKANNRGARICSICTGAFVLGAAGLLDNKKVTTHWHHAELLASMFTRVKVDPSSLYIQDGNIITSAGSASGLDMMLYIVRKDYGYRAANMVAQRLVIPAYRDGGQPQVRSKQSMFTSQTKVAEIMDWTRSNLSENHTVNSLASKVNMTPRTFQRTFKNVVGLTAMEWLVSVRIDHVKELLTTSNSPIANIAYHCGFGSERSLRHHFRKQVGISPSEFRKNTCNEALLSTQQRLVV